ncbi:MAG: hypothetical protein QOD06_103 [Candidatus Binatota bacterium]|nr:hypothetical protein [Candidatus Binatota bacterium]
MTAEKPPEIGGIGHLGREYLAGRLRQQSLQGEFRPSRRGDVPEVASLEPGHRRALAAAALAALRRGEVAYGILAAGASTRMDLSQVPASARTLLERSGRPQPKSKALVPVVEIDGRVFSFLDLFFHDVARFSAETRTANPVLLFTSEANRDEILSFLESARWLGVERGRVLDFQQTLDDQIVATAEDVERTRENFGSDADVASALALSRAFAGHNLHVPKPAGHGEFLHQLVSSGTLVRLLARGVRYVSVRNIDNTGALLDQAWLEIFGVMLEADRRFLVEVSRRPDGPAGKGGALIARPKGELQLAEDPSFAGTGVDPRDSYYINNAVAILHVDYLFRIYETSEDELARAGAEELAEIAERGRRKFPPLIDVKPVRLGSGAVAGAFVRETNLWESTGVEPGLGVGAIGVLSVKDVEDGFERLPPAEQRERAIRVRFVATKKWEDYEGVNARLVPHVARRVLEGPLVDPSP